MYPTFDLFGFTIYTFGIVVSLAWIVFFTLLHKYSLERGIIKPIFNQIVPFTIAIFGFSRVFHIMTDWLNEKFIFIELISGNFLMFLRLLFIPQQYMFSLFGAIFGFIIVFLVKAHAQKKDRLRYIDAILPAFLISSLIGYVAAFLGGQIYGIPFSSFISTIYDSADSIVKERSPIFPLAPLYILITIGIIIGVDRFKQGKILPDGFSGYLSIGLYACMIFLCDFLSGNRKDMFYDYFSLSLNQIGAVIGILFAILGLFRLIEKKI